MTAPLLIVDDDENLLRGYERWLRRRFQVVTATSATEGLLVCQSRGPFAVVVSDQQMPGISGIEFLTRLRELFPDTLRIILTGGASMEAAVESGLLFRYLTKPCPLEELIQVIDSGIAQYRAVT